VTGEERKIRMNIRLVRHATLVVELGGKTLLIDPMLGEVGEFMSFLNYSNNRVNPTASLPTDPNLSSKLSKVDAAFVTHMHQDHFDTAAEKQLREDLQIFCQPAGEGQPPDQSDEAKLHKKGFSSVQPVEDSLQLDGFDVWRTDGQHGPGDVGRNMGPVSGFVLRSHNEPSLYIAGDTIWCTEVEEALEGHQPEIVVVNAGAAQMKGKPPPITMPKEDVAEVCRHMPSATVIAVHMEAIDHCLLRRKELADFIEGEGLSEQVRIPADGEGMQF
jgi:L-ascorbate metabolism protein UlaG (beta-lactamase superfamily)